jgi:hypothetical protein
MHSLAESIRVELELAMIFVRLARRDRLTESYAVQSWRSGNETHPGRYRFGTLGPPYSSAFPDPLVPIGWCNLRLGPKRPEVSITLASKERDVPKRTAKLTHPNIVEFPFTFDIGDEAFHNGDKASIKGGTFEGDRPEAYQITYVTKTADGKIRLIPQQELLKTTRKG